jgi:myo-inositol-1(or 4)-monophosphatase
MQEQAVAAIHKAGKLIMRHFGSIQQDQIDVKMASDFVTFVDRESESILITELQRAFPDHSFYAEESSRAPKGGYRWIIDPLDGTTNYIHGSPLFTISVALEHEGDIILGLVYEPVRDELFSAEKGKGAFLNGKPIHVSGVQDPDASLLSTGFPFRQKEKIDAYLAGFKEMFMHVSGIRRMGSAALDLSYVACGRFEGFWEMGLSPWDVAAGALLIQEAGGKFTDFSGGEGAIWSGDVVASNGHLHDLLVSITRKHLVVEHPR